MQNSSCTPVRRLRGYLQGGTVIALACLLAACGSSGPDLTPAQQYTRTANLKVADLPSGWVAQAPVSYSFKASKKLTSSEASTLEALAGGLPAVCDPIKAVFAYSITNSAPSGAVAQSFAQFHSVSDGTVQLSSDLVVFKSQAEADTFFGLYDSSAFPACLQRYLSNTIEKVFQDPARHVTVEPLTGAAAPAGVRVTGFSTQQSGTKAGQQTDEAASSQFVLQSGRAVVTVLAQNALSSLPADAVYQLDHAAEVVAKRISTPPA